MNHIKLPKQNDYYIKTFRNNELIQNDISIISFEHLGNENIVDFIENLIYDLIYKRKLVGKNIVVIADSLTLKETLLETLFAKGIYKNESQSGFSSNVSGGDIYHWSDMDMEFNEIFALKHINSDLNNALIIADKSILKNVNNTNYDLFNLKDIGNKKDIDTFIIIDFEKIRDYDESALEKLRRFYPNTKWVGINSEFDKERMYHIQLGDEIIDMIPEIPETFNGFVNASVQENLIKVIRALGNNQDALAFEGMYKRGVFENENTECQLEIGTQEFIENEADLEADDIENTNEFYVSIKINRYSLELECQLQDYDWSGTGFANYSMDFEYEINEKKNINELDDIFEAICQYISNKQVTVNTIYSETINS